MDRRLRYLTDEQYVGLAETRAAWLDIGLSCERCHFGLARTAASNAYRNGGFAPPTHWVLADSPMSAMICDAILQFAFGTWRVGGEMSHRLVGNGRRNEGSVDAWEVDAREVVSSGVCRLINEHVREPLEASIGRSVRAPIGTAARADLHFLLDDEDFDPVWESVGETLSQHIAPTLWDLLWDREQKRIRVDSMPTGVSRLDSQSLLINAMSGQWNHAFGAHDADWLSFHAFLLRHTFVEHARPLEPYMNLARHCGWWLPRKDLCILQHRPLRVHRDDAGMLHNDVGPAVEYRDGWKIWMIHGVQVDEIIVLRPEQQTVHEIMNDRNEEVRRVRIERFGWSRFLRESNARVLDARENPIENTKEMLARIWERMSVLVCHCPSQGKMFALEVPPDTQTCEEAQNYLHSGSRIDDLVGPLRTIGRS